MGNNRPAASEPEQRALDGSPDKGSRTLVRELRHTFHVDASCNLDRGIVGIGVVMRANENVWRKPGPIVDTFFEAYVGIPPGDAEKFAIFRALEIAAERSATRVKVRSDYNHMRTSLKEDHALGAGLDRTDLHGRVLRLAALFQEVKFAYVRRRKNQTAHHLARKAVRECTPVRRDLEPPA